MKAIVDADACTGCGTCVDACPEVFELNDDDVAEVIANPVPKEAAEACREAAEACPVEAITIENGE